MEQRTPGGGGSRRLLMAFAVAAALVLSACGVPATTAPATERSSTAAGGRAAGPPTSPAQSGSGTAVTPSVDWLTTPAAGATGVPVDTRVVARVSRGSLTGTTLRYTSKKGSLVEVKGALKSGTWTAGDLLEPGVTYTLAMTGTDASGAPTGTERTFTTAPLTLNDQIYVKVIPDGQTVGIGMPVIVTFDLPVLDRATFERRLKVTSVPAQEGSWHWLSSREVHWRAKSYWRPGTKVHVEANLNGVAAGGNRFGQQSRVADFTVGRSVVAKVNLATHLMDVFVSGATARTIPISGGRPGWETRSGVKVIMEKLTSFEMQAESIGLKKGDKNYYEKVTVRHALRLTNSGEFLHSAPWSVSQQGLSNVSHGCTGMSNASSDWVSGTMRIGDVVETTGSAKPMTMGNGYADWNLSWAAYRKGSALRRAGGG